MKTPEGCLKKNLFDAFRKTSNRILEEVPGRISAVIACECYHKLQLFKDFYVFVSPS